MIWITGLCETCRQFVPLNHTRGIGLCDNDKFPRYGLSRTTAQDIPQDGASMSLELFVGPKFGCVHHTPKV